MVSDAGGFDDKSFNQLGFEGLTKAADELGVEPVTVQSDSETDYAPNLTNLVDQGCNLIVTVGFALAAAAGESAEANPDIEYVSIDDAVDLDFDGTTDFENIKPIIFDTAQAAFLAGYAAAGVLADRRRRHLRRHELPDGLHLHGRLQAGRRLPQHREGHERRRSSAGTATDGLFTGGFEANDTARNTAQGLIDQNVDVLLPVGGPIYQSAAAAIRDSGREIAMIGVDADFTETDPSVADLMLTSILKGIDVGTYEAVLAAGNGEFDNTPFVGTLENEGVGIAPFHDFESKVAGRAPGRARRPEGRDHRRRRRGRRPTSQSKDARTDRGGRRTPASPIRVHALDGASRATSAHAACRPTPHSCSISNGCGHLTRIGDMKLELRGITKRFGSLVANDHIDLTVEPGEIHCLLGENGAGKSTLMNVLYGLYQADEGEILLDDQVQHFAGPGDAMAAGIGMVHQHFMLIPVFTVAENVMLGHESTRAGGLLDLPAARAKVREISERFGFHVDPDALVDDLPVGVQQRVEIIKALSRDARVLVFDEPTAVLTPQETDELMGIMRQLKETGTSIVFITHKLREVREVADRITVIRLGKVVGEAAPTATNAELASLMVGRAVELTVQKEEPTLGDAGARRRGPHGDRPDRPARRERRQLHGAPGRDPRRRRRAGQRADRAHRGAPRPAAARAGLASASTASS